MLRQLAVILAFLVGLTTQGLAFDPVRPGGGSSSSGSGTPGGTNGQIQYNNSGSFGGVTAGGSCSANQWVDAIGSTLSVTCAQPAFTNISGTLPIARVDPSALSGGPVTVDGGTLDTLPFTNPAGTAVPSTTGTQTASDLVKIDSDGGHVAIGGDPAECDTGNAMRGITRTGAAKNCFVPSGSGSTPVTFSANTATTTQSINAASYTKVVWPTVADDSGSYWDATNNRYLPLVAGVYHVSAAVPIGFKATVAGQIATGIYKNGSLHRQAFCLYMGASVDLPNPDCIISADMSFNGSSDYVEIFLYQSSGASPGAQSVEASAVDGWFTVHKVN